jgi:hypothetical protein
LKIYIGNQIVQKITLIHICYNATTNYNVYLCNMKEVLECHMNIIFTTNLFLPLLVTWKFQIRTKFKRKWTWNRCEWKCYMISSRILCWRIGRRTEKVPMVFKSNDQRSGVQLKPTSQINTWLKETEFDYL